MALYELHQYQDPGFPILFHYDYLGGQASHFSAHWHEGVELLLCTQGRVQALLDGAASVFQPGEMAVVGSGQIHTLHPLEPDNRYYCLIVSRGFLEQNGLSCENMALAPVVREREAISLYGRIVEEMEARGPHYKSMVLGLALQLCALLWRREQAERPAGSSRHPQAVKKAIYFLRAHFSAPDALEAACRAAGVTRSTLCHLFKRYVAMTPVEFLNALRCQEARSLLAAGECNVSEAARRVGVENLSYFSRLYRRHTGALPSQSRPAGGGQAEE